MTNQIKLIREISYDENETPIEGLPTQRLEITVDGDATLPELLQQFEQFVVGMGYVPPAGAHLDYVDDDAGNYNGCGCDCDHP